MTTAVNFEKLNSLVKKDQRIEAIVRHVQRLVKQKQEIVWSNEYQSFLKKMNLIQRSWTIEPDTIIELWVAGEQVYGEWSIIGDKKTMDWIEIIKDTQINFTKCSEKEEFNLDQLQKVVKEISVEMERMASIHTLLGAYLYKNLVILYHHARTTKDAILSWR